MSVSSYGTPRNYKPSTPSATWSPTTFERNHMRFQKWRFEQSSPDRRNSVCAPDPDYTSLLKVPDADRRT